MPIAVSGFAMLAILLVLVGWAALLIITGALARLILAPPRLTDARALFLFHRMSPGDLGLKFEEMQLVVSASPGENPLNASSADCRIAMSAWWIPADRPSDACVILLHGYSDAKIGAIAWAPMLHSLGLHVMAIDLRAHGESGGRHFTAGYFERHDIDQVICELQAQRQRQTRRLILFGINCGATVAIATACLREEQVSGFRATTAREKKTSAILPAATAGAPMTQSDLPPPCTPANGDIAAVILDGPFPDYRRALTGYLRVIGSPGTWLHRRIMASAQRISRADFAAVNLSRTLANLRCPVMLIQNAGDRFLDSAAVKEMHEIAARRAVNRLTVYWRSDKPSPFETGEDVRSYQQRVAAFLEQALSFEATAAPDAAK